MPLSAVGGGGFSYDGISFRADNQSLSHKTGSNALDMTDIFSMILPTTIARAKLVNTASVVVHNVPAGRIGALVQEVPNAVVVTVQARAGADWRVRSNFVSVVVNPAAVEDGQRRPNAHPAVVSLAADLEPNP